jgi:hypothetical protein
LGTQPPQVDELLTGAVSFPVQAVKTKLLHKILFLLIALTVSPISLSSEVDGVANYAYSVFVGTGKYKVEDRTIYVFSAPLEFDIKEIDYDKGHNVGLKLLVPVAVGVTNFEFIEELPEFDVNDIQTVSVVPGLEIPIALSKRWQLKPFVQAGFGVDAKSDSYSFVWGAGARTRGTYGDDSRWKVGGEYLWAGNNPSGDNSTTSFGRLGIGVEYKIPTTWSVGDRYISWHLRALQRYFTDAVDFEEPVLPSKLKSATELGLSFGLSRPIRVLGYDFTQLGVGYEWASDIKAIKFFTTFPF